MSDPFVAEVRIFPFNFAPKGWAFCNGQVMAISQNTALFALLGTTYGGNGTSNFALPNFQGIAPMHPRQGPGLSLHDLGETAGSQTVTLLESEMPSHAHTWSVDPAAKRETSLIANNTPAGSSTSPFYATVSASDLPNVSMNPGTLANAGGNQPHDNMQPYLCLNFCIALQGVFPSRP